MNLRKVLIYVLVLMMLLLVGVGCGNSNVNNTQGMPETEEFKETESEFYMEIADATEILTKTWEMYAQEERFAIMGGHFETAVIDMPAKYDLTQTMDLTQMYCIPESQVGAIDDAATMIDLYNAGRFMVGAFHVTVAENARDFAIGIQSQVLGNQWHGEKPEKILVVKIDEQYVISVCGRELLVDQFKQKLEAVYQEMVMVMIEERVS
ncbi:MAG: hypothetical protein IJE49_05980 [Agathobacter sp.]|nr:hypothetical protein [Agathobacter sp.]